ncbi:MAG: SGNH/GDSL hydrolase family protein [Cyanobacteriota bacterium]|nr:SGNH/GDSL hydrolase family protein [Cyanobacteriota bacterium]
MTSTLVILGASLMDAGNIAGLGPLMDLEPFAEKIYDKGGNVRASDGPVLGERFVEVLGGDPEDAQLFNVLSLEQAAAADVHNYAHGGAQSDEQPSKTLLGIEIGIGLASQVQSLKGRRAFYEASADVDALISAGANDLLQQLDDLDPFLEVLSTRRRRDDRRLARTMSRPIFRNIRDSVDQITGLLDEVVVFGSHPITFTPKALERTSELEGDLGDQVLGLFDAIGDRLNRRLSRRFGNNDQVLVLDVQSLWDELESPEFLDDVHPTTRTSLELAELAVPIIQAQFESFGFA